MPFYQLDASAVVKRYVDEIGSAWVRGLAADTQNNVIGIADLTRVEVASAFARRVREGTLTPDEGEELLRTFLAHAFSEYHLIATGSEIVDEAVGLTQRHPLRAYDAVQLATAMTANRALLDSNLPRPTFVSADDRLLEAAVAEGLAVENANQHLL